MCSVTTKWYKELINLLYIYMTKQTKMKSIKFFALVAVILFTSCEKESVSGCYECTYGTINGYTPPPDEYCGPMPYVKKDAQGNEYNTFCRPK